MKSLKDLGYEVFKKKNAKMFSFDFLESNTTIEIEKKADFERLIMINQDTNVVFLSETEIKAICEELKEE